MIGGSARQHWFSSNRLWIIESRTLQTYNWTSNANKSSAEGLGDITDFQTDLNAPSAPVQSTSFPNVPSAPNVQAVAPVAPAPAPPVNAQQAVAPAPAPNPIHATTAAAGPKRKHTQKSTQASAEEAAKDVADEDKRRRNTAASARFRVKKKMREQALERTVKETNEKNDALEARVSQLELENHWLRGLVMDKNGTEERSEASDKALSDAFKNFLESRKSESSPAQSKLGVGTGA